MNFNYFLFIKTLTGIEIERKTIAATVTAEKINHNIGLIIDFPKKLQQIRFCNNVFFFTVNLSGKIYLYLEFLPGLR